MAAGARLLSLSKLVSSEVTTKGDVSLTFDRTMADRPI